MAVDPYGRLLYWTCANTNAINVTRLDNGSAVGVVVKVDGEKPRNIALHPEKGYVKYCNFSLSFLFIYIPT
jgi:low density lipoprotein receptor-related protein 5/6